MRLSRRRTTTAVLLAVLGAAAVAAGCSGGTGTGTGGSGGSPAGAGYGATRPSPGPTGVSGRVGVRQVPGLGTVLVDGAGGTLYVTDQDSGGRIRCTESCLQIWKPLSVPRGGSPAAGGEVTGRLSTVDRTDGTTQVTYDGRPLYTFAFDAAPGATSGNGVTDDFGGTRFVWHAATTSGTAPATSPSTDGYGSY